ncbi:MIP1 [[Candida] subhashii]|uniref:MIP1 n=1 Tax=[Candida] subhashii TaxID=561895 RepID=A0A8J5QQK4_9ASCO|nr:MIP1 [[Candida] subhashii]KAG7665589.1 MIP1 [[Candida] subhashii]
MIRHTSLLRTCLPLHKRVVSLSSSSFLALRYLSLKEQPRVKVVGIRHLSESLHKESFPTTGIHDYRKQDDSHPLGKVAKEHVQERDLREKKTQITEPLTIKSSPGLIGNSLDENFTKSGQRSADHSGSMATVFFQENNNMLQLLQKRATQLVEYIKKNDPSLEPDHINDPWLSQLDWTIKQPRIKKDGTPYAKQAFLTGYPEWYRDLFREKKTMHISLRTRVTPLLLGLKWEGYPLVWHQTQGWCFRVPSVHRIDMRKKGYTVVTKTAELHQALNQGERTYLLFRIPHPDGDTRRCMLVLSKLFGRFFDNGVLASEYASDIILNNGTSYLMGNRDRSSSQIVDNQEAIDESFENKIERSIHKDMGTILPQSVPTGTTARRTTENSRLSVSAPKEEKESVLSKLKMESKKEENEQKPDEKKVEKQIAKDQTSDGKKTKEKSSTGKKSNTSKSKVECQAGKKPKANNLGEQGMEERKQQEWRQEHPGSGKHRREEQIKEERIPEEFGKMTRVKQIQGKKSEKSNSTLAPSNVNIQTLSETNQKEPPIAWSRIHHNKASVPDVFSDIHKTCVREISSEDPYTRSLIPPQSSYKPPTIMVPLDSASETLDRRRHNDWSITIMNRIYDTPFFVTTSISFTC